MISKRKNNPFHDYLNYDEEILWSGQPHPTRLNENCGSLFGYLLQTFFTLIWSGVMYIVAITMMLSGQYWFLLIPHFWIGVWLFPVSLIWAYMKRRNTYYAVTTQRVLVLNRFSSDSLTSLYLDDVETVRLDKDTKGYGTISLGGDYEQLKGKRTSMKRATIILEQIPEVARVYRGISSMQAEIRDMQREHEQFVYDYDLYEEDRRQARKRG